MPYQISKNIKDADIHILSMSQNDLEINALQRASTVILQKSMKEGFGLTVWPSGRQNRLSLTTLAGSPCR